MQISSTYILSALFTECNQQSQMKMIHEQHDNEQLRETESFQRETESFQRMTMEFDRVESFMDKNDFKKKYSSNQHVGKSPTINVKHDVDHKELYRQKIKEMLAIKKLKSKNNKIYKGNDKLRILEREDRNDDKKVCISENRLVESPGKSVDCLVKDSWWEHADDPYN